MTDLIPPKARTRKRVNLDIPEELYNRLSARFHDPLRGKMQYGKLTSLIITLLVRYVRENPLREERPLRDDEL